MKKKTIIMIVAIVVALLVIGGVVYFFVNKQNQNEGDQTPKIVEEGRVGKLYKKLSESKQYTLTRTVDADNSIQVSVKGDTGSKIAIANGQKYTYLVKDGNTYFLQTDTKKYYEYLNNDSLLTEITAPLEEMREVTYVSGKEKINKKDYYYEEVEGVQGFLVDTRLAVTNRTGVKTRFYFSGDTLVYVKTILQDKEELIKIDISDKVDDNSFTIPNDYTNAEEKEDVQEEQE